MGNRIALVSAVAAGCFVGIGFATFATGAAFAADECRATPGGAAPAGAHWYYRSDKVTKRKCWYLADEGAKVIKPASTDASGDTSNSAPSSHKAIKPTVANAHAEMRTSGNDDDETLAHSTWPPLSPSENAPADANAQNTAAQPVQADPSPQPNWNMASRWPDPNATSSTDPSSATSASQQTAPILVADQATDTTASTAASTPQAAPSPNYGDTFPIRIFLSVLVGVLALAAIIGPVIFKYLPRRRGNIRNRPIWDLETPHPGYSEDEEAAPPVRPASPRYATQAQGQEIEAILAEISRRSPALRG